MKSTLTFVLSECVTELKFVVLITPKLYNFHADSTVGFTDTWFILWQCSNFIN